MPDTQAPRNAPPLSILMYHQIGRFDAAPRRHRAGYCRVERFRRQMRWLAALGYRVISLDDALRGLFGGQRIPPRSVVLTFDDGYRNFSEYAFPVLEHHGFPATVFLVADRIGQHADWLRDGQVQAPLMDADTIRELHARGVTFGSHTLDHPRLTRLSPEAQWRELSESRERLESLLQAPVRHFCYPYGDYDAATRDLARRAGYESALTCIRGAANHADNPWEIPRKAISWGDSLVGYAWKLHMKHRRKDRT